MNIRRRKPPKSGIVRNEDRVRCAAHRQWVRGHECAVADRVQTPASIVGGRMIFKRHECRGKIQAAHVRTGTDGATGIKPSDSWTIPLCEHAHLDEQHPWGEPAFERVYGIDMKKIAAELWQRSPAGIKYRAAHTPTGRVGRCLDR